MAKLIVSNAKPSARPPINAGELPKRPPKVAFSFQHWRQIRYFGFERTQKDWFVGMLERLNVISGLTRAQWDNQARGSDAWRYHRIDWNATHIPIRKADLDWLPKDMLNEENYPFYQFGLGAGHGRVAGFWETDDRFAIVLLDPHHNLQPAGGKYGYRVTDCATQPSQAALVHLAVDRARTSLKCAEGACEVHQALATITVRKRIDGAQHYNEVISFGLDESDQKNLGELLAEKRARSVNDVFKKGVDALVKEWIDETDGG